MRVRFVSDEEISIIHEEIIIPDTIPEEITLNEDGVEEITIPGNQYFEEDDEEDVAPPEGYNSREDGVNLLAVYCTGGGHGAGLEVFQCLQLPLPVG